MTLGGRKVLLVKPMTYMNLSGEAVHEAASFYKIPPERVLVVPTRWPFPGKIRVRKNGSAGGHNGLKTSLPTLAPTSFPGVRVGWARSPTRL